MLHSAIQIDSDAIAALCRKFGVTRLRVFGSALRSDFDPARSDVDILVEFAPGVRAGLFTLVQLEEELAGVFGRKVDLLTPNGLSKYIRERVLAAAEPIYVAA